ncbi:MAG: GNAT family N-acetyltransferase [Bacteroidia bacterium]|nr:GNAT family N-acetyltransferase [Bacteroidia bacterium]
MKGKTYIFRQAQMGDEARIAAIQLKGWKDAYAGILAADYLNNLDTRERVRVWREIIHYAPSRSCLLVIECEREIVGFASGGVAHDQENKYHGEIYSLYLQREFQGIGLGKELLLGMVNELKTRGFRQVELNVLKGSRTIGFYEKMGGEIIREDQTPIGGEYYPECVFFWDLSQPKAGR